MVVTRGQKERQNVTETVLQNDNNIYNLQDVASLSNAEINYTNNFEHLKSNEPKQFKSIKNHIWGTDDTLYNDVIMFLKSNGTYMPEHLKITHEKKQKKNRNTFRNFARQYKIDENDQLYIIDRHVSNGTPVRNHIKT